ncbi:MAG: phosphatidate cytidylyltransferase [Oceanococcus sp.]
MLKQRIITALILIPLVFAALWYLPTAGISVLVGGLMLACAWEWSLFVPLQKSGRIAYAAVAAALMAVAHPDVYGAQLAQPWLFAGLLWWLAASVWLRLYPRGFADNAPAPWLRALIGYLAIVPCYIGFWQLHSLPQGRELIFLLLFLVWATDTGGYFAGKQFGRRKLAVQISPKKTWEGLIGGVALAVLLALLGNHIVFQFAWITALSLGLLVALVSVVGDLMVSMFKRQTGIKDTGNLFPGHGGALDRLDSMLSAAPVMLALCLYLAAA